MKANASTRRERPPAWLTLTALGLLLATALFLLLYDLRWGALALALSTGLTAAFALFQVRSARAGTSTQKQEAPEPSPIRQETGSGLPVNPTTGLYKPWILRGRLTEEIARAERHRHSLAIVVLEPANLLTEPTPETYGRAAKALRAALRSSDFAAQFDDERFGVLLPETEMEGAKVAGKRLLSSLRSSGESPIRWRGALVSYPEDGASPDALLEKAIILLRPGRLESTTQSMAAPPA